MSIAKTLYGIILLLSPNTPYLQNKILKGCVGWISYFNKPLFLLSMQNMYKFLLLSVSLIVGSQSFSQPKPVIPLMRRIFHENVDRTQKWIDKLDKKDDNAFNPTSDTEVNLQINYSLYNKVDQIQNDLEADTTIDSNERIKFLRGLNDALGSFETQFKQRRIKGEKLPELVNGFSDAMELDKKGGSIAPVIESTDLDIGNILIKCFSFQKNVGLDSSKNILTLKTITKYPGKIMAILRNNPNADYADSLLKIVAHTQQEEIYTYAQAPNSELGKKIISMDDPLVQTIVKLAKLNEGRIYFPFLDNLYRGRVTMEEIDQQKQDVFKYYRLLVNTQIDYAERVRKRDTPMAMEALTDMLRQKALDEFINIINGLHDSPDNIRMKQVETLNPQELYYLCVMGENEIYTSSYLKVYDRIFQRLKNPHGDTLLLSVNFDHFKKFIKMAANYNKLDDFLKRMNKGNAEILMRSFAAGLDKTRSLEDAVDVADSYASISDPALRKLILEEVQSNITQENKETNKRGYAIYDLMNTIFLSLDTTNKTNLSEKFGIPPIFSVNNAELRTEKNKIIIQQFFYGDQDGAWQYAKFKSSFRIPNWKITEKSEWLEVTSTKGTPITIYSNKALDEKLGLDEKAQQDLNDYLIEQEVDPSIIIHRGHSYHVSSTIQQLVPLVKIVLLGSCGGFQNVNRVLGISPYAHIIASKQVGSGSVNEPLIMAITETLRQGKDINWPEMWKGLSKSLKGNALFEDYIPPYKNLGALFIMAYNRVMMEGAG